MRGARRAGQGGIAAIIVIALSTLPALQAAELPITKNSPIPDFQNRTQDVVPYDFDAPPQGLFRTITTAEGFDEELGFHRTHEIVPDCEQKSQSPPGPNRIRSARCLRTFVPIGQEPMARQHRSNVGCPRSSVKT